MEYKILSKLYYKNKEEYEKLYSARINGEGTFLLPFLIHNETAFVCLCSEIFKLQTDIMQIDKKIHDVCRLLPPVALIQFTKRSLIDEIVLTNNIEGVHSSRREISEALASVQENGPQKRFHGLINKYNLLSEHELPLKTCQDIRHIYDDLVLAEVWEDNAKNVPDGKWFRKELSEVTTVTGRVIHKGSYPESKIIEDMNNALTILNNAELPGIIRISVFHYLFGYIHPFYDGNGRTSRFISSYLLARELESLIGYRLSYTIKERINEYYQAFKFCNDPKSRGDITPFVITFMEIIKESAKNLYTALEKRFVNFGDYAQKISEIESFNNQDIDFYLILLQARLFSDHGISKIELQEATNLSAASVNNKLSYVEKMGYLKKQRVGRFCYYEFDIERLS